MDSELRKLRELAANRLADMLDKQNSAWSSGAGWSIEDAIKQLDDLPANERQHVVLDLIMHEVVLREHLGQKPTLEEYQQRFPTLADALRIQWQIDELIGSSELDQAMTTIGETVTPKQIRKTTIPFESDRYEFLKQLGRGGIGVVFEVFDRALKRNVALKRLRSGEDATQDELSRLKAECEAIAKVGGDYIVYVYDQGVLGGQPYFTMELCRGGSLSKRIRGNPIAPQIAAEIGTQLCKALAAAHACQIIHRDLKPDNILLTDEASWRVKVADFGLAKFLDGTLGTVTTGIGTPSYMAPEQAFTNSQPVGPATDIYAIGAILYECLTGGPPFRGVNAAEILLHVRLHDPVSIRGLAPSVPLDLETIVHKCLQKDPSRRYRTARELEEDLERFLTGRPISARRTSTAEKAWRLCRRNPIVSLVSAAAILLMIGSIIVLAGLNAINRKQRDDLRVALTEKSDALETANSALADRDKAMELANQNQALAQGRLYSAQVNLANEALLQGKPARAETLLQSAIASPEQMAKRGFEWWALQNQLHRNLRFDVEGQGSEIACLAVSADGKRYLAAGGNQDLGSCYLVDSESGKVLAAKSKLSAIVNGCAIDSTRNHVILAQGNGYLTFMDDSFKIVHQEKASVDFRSLAISSDGKWLAGGGDQGEVYFRNLDTKEFIVSTGAHKGPVIYCFFSHDAKDLFTCTEWGGEGKMTRQWSLSSWPATHVRDYPDVVAHDISQDGTTVVGTNWGKLKILNTIDGAIASEAVLSTGPIARAMFVNDEDILVATRTDREIKRIDSRTLLQKSAYSMRNPVMDMVLHRTSGTWASGDSRGSMRIWNLDAPSPTLQSTEFDARFANFMQDGQRLILGCRNAEGQIWEPSKGRLSPIHDRREIVATTPDGKTQVCLTGRENGVSRYDVWKEGSDQAKTIFFQGEIYDRCLALSSSGRWLALRRESNDTLVYDLNASSVEPKFQVPGMAYCFAFSPDDRWMFQGCQAGIVACFDLRSGQARDNFKEWESFWAWGMSVAISPDSTLIGCGSESGVVRVWKIQTGELVNQIITGEGEVVAIDFFPDNRRIAIGGSSGNVLIADFQTAQELFHLPTSAAPIYSIDVNDRGDAVAAVTTTGITYYWSGTPHSPGPGSEK